MVTPQKELWKLYNILCVDLINHFCIKITQFISQKKKNNSLLSCQLGKLDIDQRMKLVSLNLICISESDQLPCPSAKDTLLLDGRQALQ